MRFVRWVLAVFVALLVTVWTESGRLDAGEIALYDNLHRRPDSIGWPEDPGEWIAQAFRTGDADMVSAVAIHMKRTGNPAGSLSLEIWDDDGSGHPGRSVGIVGAIDVAELPTDWVNLTVESRVSGLTPDSTYYVVLNSDSTTVNTNDHFDIATMRSSDGSSGAGRMQVKLPGWTVFSGNLSFLAMAVTATIPSLLGDFDGDGVLSASDIDLLVVALHEPPVGLQFDVNGDGTADLLDHAYWITDLKNAWIGDANLDGEFNSADMVYVFQAGKYELDVDAGWAQGDWTGDRRFDSGDLVVAFQDGGYELAAGGAVSAVPEPGSATLLWMGMTVICRLRQRRKCRAGRVD